MHAHSPALSVFLFLADVVSVHHISHALDHPVPSREEINSFNKHGPLQSVSWHHLWSFVKAIFIAKKHVKHVNHDKHDKQVKHVKHDKHVKQT